MNIKICQFCEYNLSCGLKNEFAMATRYAKKYMHKIISVEAKCTKFTQTYCVNCDRITKGTKFCDMCGGD